MARRINRARAGDAEQAARYPDDWTARSRALIDAAGGRCACICVCHCGADREAVCGRAEAAGYQLQIAHLDDTPEHVDPSNLLVMCRACHVRYDNQRKRGTVRTVPVVAADHTDFAAKAELRAAAWRRLHPRPAGGHLWLPMSGCGDLLLDHFRRANNSTRWPWDAIRACDVDQGVIKRFCQRFAVRCDERRAERYEFDAALYAAADIDAYDNISGIGALHRFMSGARLAARLAIILTLPTFSFSRSRVFDLDQGVVTRDRLMRDRLAQDPAEVVVEWLRRVPGVVRVDEVGGREAKSERYGSAGASIRTTRVHYLGFLVERQGDDPARAPAAAVTVDAPVARKRWDFRPRVLPRGWLRGP